MMSNTTTAEDNGTATLYNDYESYNFVVTPWEDLDDIFRTEDTTSDDPRQQWFEQFVNHKIKFFAYLNFFSNEQDMSMVQSGFRDKYKKAIDKLVAKSDPLALFPNEQAYAKLEADFVAELDDEQVAKCYAFFRKNYNNFFNKIGDGFFVKVNGKALIEQDVIREGTRAAKKITTWDQRSGNYINKILRAYPLMYFSPKAHNELRIQFVCFIDGYIRNSIDYTDGEKIYRIYLPLPDVNALTMAEVKKERKVTTFTAKKDAIAYYLKNNLAAPQFDPDATLFDTSLKLEAVSTNKDLRGCSIY
jgi:hypothetical protein